MLAKKWQKNMGQITRRETQKKGTRYTARVRVAGQPIMVKTFGTKKAALRWSAEAESRLRSNLRDQEDASGMEFARLLDRYLSTVTTRKAVNTQTRDRFAARVLLRYFGGSVLGDITPGAVAAYRDTRLATVSACTLHKELAVLSHMFNVARREWGLAVRNSVQEIARPKTAGGRLRFLSMEEASALLEASGKSRNRNLKAFITLLLHTGMRPSEAAGLRWDRVDLANKSIEVQNTKTIYSRTGIRGRRIPLTDAAAAALEEIEGREEQVEARRLKAEGRKSKGKFVFLPEDGIGAGTISRPALYFRTAFETACRRAGLRDFRMHDCRHTAASWLVMSGVDIRTVAEILGHSTLAMTMRYTHLLEAHKREAVNRIGKLGILGQD
jgi:integrase